MMKDELRITANEMYRQLSNKATPSWEDHEWQQHTERLVELIGSEVSALRLGDVLRLDAGLDMPVDVIRAVYLRLFELGATDVRTKLCYAGYLLLHGPEWDEEANAIVHSCEGPARAAGIWDSTILGHHPVFYAGED